MAQAPIIASDAVSTAAAQPLQPRRSFYKRHEPLILGGGAVVFTLAIWQALWSAGKISPLFFSGPSAIAQRFGEEIMHGRLRSDMRYSGINFILGFTRRRRCRPLPGRPRSPSPSKAGRGAPS